MENIFKEIQEKLSIIPIYYCYFKISVLFDSFYFIPTICWSFNKNYINITINFLIICIEFSHNNNDKTFKFHHYYTPIIVFKVSYFTQYKYEFCINWYNLLFKKEFCENK